MTSTPSSIRWMLDAIVTRRELKTYLIRALDFMLPSTIHA